MKKLLIFLLLFAFGFGGYCDDWVEVANQSYSLDGSYDHIPLYTVPDTDTYRIKIIVTSCTAPNTNWGYQTNIWKNGSLLMQAFLHTYDYFPCTATSNKALTAGDILTVNCQYAAPVSISFQVIIYKVAVVDPDDIDGDGIPNINDPDHPDYNPADPNSDPDDDGIPNSTDPDDDGDGTPDVNDPDHPDYNSADPGSDPDGDGTPNSTDPDDDGDGTPDTIDPSPYDPNISDPDPIDIPDLPDTPEPLVVPDTPIEPTPEPEPDAQPENPADNIDNDDDVPTIKHLEVEVLKKLTYNEALKNVRDVKLYNLTAKQVEAMLIIGDTFFKFIERVEPNILKIQKNLEAFYGDFDLWSTTFDFNFSQLASDVYDLMDITVESIAPLLVEIADNANIIKTDVGVIKTDIGVVKTNVIEINNKLTNIADVITLLDTNQSEKLESIKGVLEQQLSVQEDQLEVQENQLTTQESILALLEQIANPDDPPPNPDMPDNPDDPVTPEYSINFTDDREAQDRNLQEYNKTFPMFGSALAQRDGTLPFILIIPLSKISSLLDDVQINFSEGVVGSLVSGLRVLLCSILFYFTLKYWFLAVRRITD